MKRGFTFIELLFVIVVLGIITMIAVSKFQNRGYSSEYNTIVQQQSQECNPCGIY